MNHRNPHIIIMAGGTGGHIFPGLAVAERLKTRGAEVSWLGARRGLENTLVPEHGIALDTLNMQGVRGKGLKGWLKAPFLVLKAVWEARRVLRAHRPDAVLSMGGYAAAPGGLAAWVSGVPLLVHEQNRVPGMTNRLLARFARRIFEGFPNSFRSRRKVQAVGNPVRSAIAQIAAPDERYRRREGPARILIFGGSQGARALNRLLPEAIAMMTLDEAPRIRHQAGRGQVENTRQRYQQYRFDAEVTEFIRDMAGAYAWADLVVCRAGASTVSELAAAGLPALFVPFPAAVDDHQTRNAEYLSEVNAAQILPEQGLTPARLSQVLSALCGSRERLAQMANAARGRAFYRAADEVADYCLGLVS